MDYDIPRSKFKSFVWVKGGEIFRRFDHIEVEFVTSETFRVELVSGTNQVLASRTSPDHGGWHTFPYINFSIGDEKFKIRFVSTGGEREIRGGTLVNYKS